MYTEDDLLPLSGLQHLHFCPRQWALIHLEQQWAENRYTAEGRRLHERADVPAVEVRGDVRIVRGLRLRSLRLGLAGVADVVEFHRCEKGAGVELDGVAGLWRPAPVEYKRGRVKRDACDEVQLCAQALCLEEMLGVEIGYGALFYGKTRRRHDVLFDAGLRDETEALCARMHGLYAQQQTPTAVYEKKCDTCSLYGLCMPKVTGGGGKVGRYLARMLADGG